MKTKWQMLVLTLVLLFSFSGQSAAQGTHEQALDTSTAYLLKQVPNPTFGDEWVILALARGNAVVPSNYYEKYYQHVVQHVTAKKGDLHEYKYTEYSRLILALSAIGKDATNVGGYNVVEKLNEFDNVIWQGINGPIFALIALDTWQYESKTREALLQHIVRQQLADGGFSLLDPTADIDITAMAIQALAPYKERADIKPVITRAVSALQAMTMSYTSTESAAQVVTALASIGQDPGAHVEKMLQFYEPSSGGFKHEMQDTEVNGMATEQASYALVAYKRYIAQQPALYAMKDMQTSFTDTALSWAKDYIEQAYQLGLLNGYADGTFRPNNYLTRTQAVSILVRALKLEHTAPVPFTDLGSMSNTTKNELAAAYEAGIIQYGNGKFQPTQKITRIQLAVMLMRAYNHLYTPFTSSAKAAFSDTITLSTEQQLAAIFVAQNGIAQGSNGKFLPANATTRAHATKMLLNFLQVVEEANK